MPPIISFEAVPEGFGSNLLFPPVNRQGNRVAVGIGVFTKPPNHFGSGHFCNIVGVDFCLRAVIAGSDGGRNRKLACIRGDVTQVLHASENPVSADHRPVGIGQWIKG